jgi:hypothetical protein
VTAIRIKNPESWHGLSSDEKPFEVPEGTTFHVVDTGEVYVFFNDAWEIDLRSSRALSQGRE